MTESGVIISATVLILAVCGSTAADTDYTSLQVQPKKDGCRISDLVHTSEHVICDQVDDWAYNGSQCDIREREAGDERYQTFSCIDGSWHHKQSGTDISISRTKRFFGFLAVALAVAVAILFVCTIENKNGRRGKVYRKIEAPVDNKAPYYEMCPPDGIRKMEKYYATPGADNVAITWDDPVAKDDDGSINSNTQTTTPLKGEPFPASVDGYPHLVSYVAQDNRGASARCDFTVYAHIHDCGAIQYPSGSGGHTTGTYTCTRTTKLGSVCTYTCNDGHELIGTGTVTCRLDSAGNPAWTAQPTCDVISCGDPATTPPPNGYIDCVEPVPHDYESVCERKCNDGYRADGTVAIKCLASKLWTTRTFSCIDDVPPMILTCTSPQLFSADRGGLTAAVNWTEPTFTDVVDPDPVIVKLDGPSQGDVLADGSHYVLYRATDASRNTSPNCTIELRVAAIPCGHPTDTMHDTFMEFSCSATSYYYGVTCQLSCQQKLPLNGSSVIACEVIPPGSKSGVWDWGTGTKPHCEVITCPALEPPKNGALSMDSINLRPVAILACQDGFDMPNPIDGFHGKLFCLDSGVWEPLHDVPGCVKSKLPWLRLPAEMYYEGPCNDKDVQEQIREKYIKLMKEMLDTPWNICSNVTTCRTENVRVVCGPTETRRRRSRHDLDTRQVPNNNIKVTWDFTVPFDKGNMTTLDAYMLLLPILKTLAEDFGARVAAGDMDIAGLTIKPDTYAYAASGDLWCSEEGYKRDGDKCKPCPRGRQLDAVSGNCELCPLGTFKEVDSEPVCQLCNAGYSTRSTGAKNREECKRVCKPGSYSLTGETPYRLEPCSPCPMGTYQESTGMDACLDCPVATTTTHTNTISQHLCYDYDLDLSGPNGAELISSNFTATMQSVTVSFWVHPLADLTAGVTININTDVAIDINLAETLFVEIGANRYDTGSSLLVNRWTYVSVMWDTETFRLDVFVNGDNFISEGNVEPATTPIINGGSVSVAKHESTALYISGFSIYDRPLSEAEMTSLQNSCAATMPDVKVTMDIFKMVDGVNALLMTPSSCDAVDECASNPCHGHFCTNKIGGFSCYCYDGWTGETCDMAPDHCINNDCEHDSQCVNKAAGYSCTCAPGYSGYFCEKAPVDGGWSDWSDFTGCDVSCGGGTQQRTRMCINPVKTAHGADCVGDSTETRACNEEICRACADRERTFGTIQRGCEVRAYGMKVCNYTCTPGKSFPRGVRSSFQYECGPSTDYTWSPITEEMPECQRVNIAERIGIISPVNYTDYIPNSQQDEVGSMVDINLEARGCTAENRCTVSTSFTTASRRKRGVGTTLSLNVGFNMTSSGDLLIDEYLENGTVSPSLQELIDTISLMNAITEQLQDNTSAVFGVSVGGVSYAVDPDSLSLSGFVQCPEGQAVGEDGTCVECPAGTRYATGACPFCDVGTFQDETGQSACKACPSGFSTAAIGASSELKCIVSVAVPTVSMATTTPAVSGGVSVAAIVGGSAGGTAAVLVAAAIAVFMWKKMRKTCAREDHNATMSYRPNSPGVISMADVQINQSPPPRYSVHDYVAILPSVHDYDYVAIPPSVHDDVAIPPSVHDYDDVAIPPSVHDDVAIPPKV